MSQDLLGPMNIKIVTDENENHVFTSNQEKKLLFEKSIWSLWRRLFQIWAFLARPGRVSCWRYASVVTHLCLSQTPLPAPVVHLVFRQPAPPIWCMSAD